jgi:integrase
MSAHAKGTRLWLRPSTGSRAAVWCIKDGDDRISTGFGERDREQAERALARHIAARHRPEKKGARPPSELSQIPVADVLNIYATEKGDGQSSPREVAARIGRLLAYFGKKTLAEVTPGASKDYAAKRGSQSSARRELEDLKAALAWYWSPERDGNANIDVAIPQINIPLPPKSAPRNNFLTHEQAVKLGKAAWRYREVQKGKVTDRASRQHIARFILVALYTGTRSGAICNAALTPAIGRGYVDLEKGIFHRRGLGVTETKKRQPEVLIHPKLLAHMRRWRRLGLSNNAVIEFAGQPVKSVKKAFARAAEDAGVEASPHTLRHTAVSWAMQSGVDIYKAAHLFGMTPEMIVKVYGHLHPEHHGEVLDAIRKPPRRVGFARAVK